MNLGRHQIPTQIAFRRRCRLSRIGWFSVSICAVITSCKRLPNRSRELFYPRSSAIGRPGRCPLPKFRCSHGGQYWGRAGKVGVHCLAVTFAIPMSLRTSPQYGCRCLPSSNWEVGHAVIKGRVPRFGAVLCEGETGRCSEGELKEAYGKRDVW